MSMDLFRWMEIILKHDLAKVVLNDGRRNALLTLLLFLCISLVPGFISAMLLFEIADLNVSREASIACVVAFTIVYTFLLYLIKGIIERCPECRCLYAMKEIRRHTVGEHVTTVDVRREVRNRKGEVVRTYYEAVPATRYVYACIDECKYCGYRRNVQRELTCRD